MLINLYYRKYGGKALAALNSQFYLEFNNNNNLGVREWRSLVINIIFLIFFKFHISSLFRHQVVCSSKTPICFSLLQSVFNCLLLVKFVLLIPQFTRCKLIINMGSSTCITGRTRKRPWPRALNTQLDLDFNIWVSWKTSVGNLRFFCFYFFIFF